MIERVRFDWRGIQREPYGLATSALEDFADRLEEARQATLLPTSDPLLQDYRRDRRNSRLNRILVTASRMRNDHDGVIVLGPEPCTLGARALIAACAHPWHNLLSPAQRGGRPRIVVQATPGDNDALAGLLDLIDAVPAESTWGLLVIQGDDWTAEANIACQTLAERLVRRSKGVAADHLVLVGRRGRLLGDTFESLPEGPWFEPSDLASPGDTMLTDAGLIPAAILGIDVVRLLEGAARMNQHFAEAATGQNAVLQFAGVSHLLRHQRGAGPCRLRFWSQALEPLGKWFQSLSVHDACLAHPAVPSAGHPGAARCWTTHVIQQQWRCDPILLPKATVDGPASLAASPGDIPGMTVQAVQVARAHAAGGLRPEGAIWVPGSDEDSVGQLIQLLILSQAAGAALDAGLQTD